MSVYEIEEGGFLPWDMGALLVKRMAHGFRAGPFLFAGDDETPIDRERNGVGYGVAPLER